MERDYLQAGYDFQPVATKFDWTFNVIQSEQPNAFCLPGGYVAVYTGILDITGNYDKRVTLDDISDVEDPEDGMCFNPPVEHVKRPITQHEEDDDRMCG